MSKQHLKQLTLTYNQASKACGPGEDVIDVLEVLIDEKVITSYQVLLQVMVPADKAASIEEFFYLSKGVKA